MKNRLLSLWLVIFANEKAKETFNPFHAVFLLFTFVSNLIESSARFSKKAYLPGLMLLSFVFFLQNPQTLHSQMYTVDQSGTFSPIAGTGTNVYLGDDQVSGALPIGFSFTFYGNVYTSFRISSNGFITFSSGQSSGCCSGDFLPDASSPNNLIAFNWNDLYPPLGGSIDYRTIGSAPNRRLVVNFNQIAHCCSNTYPPSTSQIILYESTNIIEIHSASVTSDGSYCTQGVENADGTVAVAVPGRNRSIWTATNDYVAFIPGGANLPPTAVCQNVTINVGNNCEANVAASSFDGGSSDPEGDALSFSVVPAGPYGVGTTNVTLTVSTPNGDMDNCAATITVTSTAPPTITCPAPVVVNTDPGQCGAIVNYNAPTGNDPCGAGVGSETFNYTGGVQTFTAPATGTYTLDVYGARGGNVTSYYPTDGGLGGNATGEINLTAGQTIYVYVGGQGADRMGNHPYSTCTYVAGGWNGGGGNRSAGNGTPGGGASDIRVGGQSLNDRVIVAGGGGGCGWYYSVGGDGGGLTGENGSQSNTVNYQGGGGGTQSQGGVVGDRPTHCSKSAGGFGIGGDGGGSSAGGGGGGGGWYGGGGGGYNEGGGGGSSYIGGVTNGTTSSGEQDGDGMVVISWSSGILASTLTGGLGAGSFFPEGTTTETYTVTGVSGQTASCSFTVTVNDNEGPQISCPMLPTASGCDAIVPDLTIAPGDVITNSSADFSGTQGTNNWEYGSYAAFDTDGFTQLPNFTGFVWNNPGVGANLDFPQLDANGGHPQFEGLTWAVRRWTSPFTGTIQISGDFYDRDGNCGDGAHVRIFHNTNQVYEYLNIPTGSTGYSFNINVTAGDRIDFAIDPKFDAACDDTHFIGVITALTGTTYSDNCGMVVNVTQSPAAGTIVGPGNTTITVTAFDDEGLSNSCTATLTVQDTEAPMAICQDVTVQLGPGGVATLTPAQVNNNSTDNCGIDPNGFSLSGQTSYDCSDEGSTFNVVLTVTDNAGLTATCPATITVSDPSNYCNLPPNAVCQNITIDADGNCQGIASGADFDGGSSDPDGDQLSFSVSPAGPYPLGTTNVTVTVTDPYGAMDVCSATITVEDNTPPTLACPGNITVSNDNGQCSAVVNYTPPIAQDNCGPIPASLTGGIGNGGTFPVGTTTETWEVQESGILPNALPTINLAPYFLSTQMDVAYNPNFDLYYATSGGNSGKTISTFDGSGTLLNVTTSTGHDWRGIWWNPNLNQLEGNPCSSCQSNGIRVQDLNASGIALATGTTSMATNQPNFQSQGDYDYDNNEIIYYDNGQIYRVDRTTNANLPTVTITGLPVSTSYLNRYLVGYSGVSGAEVMVYDYVNYQVHFINKATGVYAGTSQLPAPVPYTGSTWEVGFANGQIFVYDPGPDTWYGYQVVIQGGGGGSASCSFTVTVNDTEAPDAQCKNVTVQLDAAGNASVSVGDINNGSSDNCGIDDIYLTGQTSYTCSDAGTTISVTLNMDDDPGNPASCTAQVTVADDTYPCNMPPVAVCQNVTVNADASCEGMAVPTDFDGGSSDPDGDVLSFSVSPAGPYPLGTTNVTLTVDDGNGETDVCSATITVNDVTEPNITCPFDITVNVDPGICGAVINYDQPSATDNCGTGNLPTSLPGFTYMGTFEGHTYFLSNSTTTPEDAHAQAIASGGHLVTINSAAENNFVSGFNSGRIWIGHTDRDSEGNWEWVTGEPVIYTNWASGEPNNAGGNEDWAVINWSGSNPDWNDWYYYETALFAIEFDGGTIPTMLDSGLGIGATFPVGTSTEVWKAIDDAANMDMCSFTITVIDNVAPTAICQNTTVQLDATGNGSITASDVDGGSNDACGIASLSVSPSSFNCSDVGANTVTLTVTDNNSLVSTCTATVTVEDNVSPTAVCQDITVYLDNTGNASILASDVDGGSMDACGLANLSVSPSTFDCSNVGMNAVTLTLTAVDNNGNPSTCQAMVMVVDNIAPNAVCQNTTVQLDANGNGSITAADVDGGSNDACGIKNLSVQPSAFGCANVGANTVTLTVTDNNNQVSTCTATVTVQDNVAPMAVCQNTTVQLDANGNGSISTADVDGGSSDACGVANLSVSQSTFGCGNVGANTVTLTVTDNNNQVSTCTATVTVQDNVAPNAVCQNATVQLDANGNGSITAADVDGGSSDACGIANLSVSPSTFTCDEVGGNTVTLTVTDNNNQVSTCTATVTVVDKVVPNAICQNATVQLDASGNGSITAADVDGGSNDACGIASLSVMPSTFSCGNVGGNTVTLTVTDNNNQVSTCTATVTVQDNVAPIAICQNATVQLDANGSGSITAADIDNGSNDACGVASLSVSPSSFDCSNLGENTVTLTVTDNNNNPATCTATVTVEDNIDPVITCPGDITMGTDAGLCGASVEFLVTATDNCDETTITCTIGGSGPSGDCAWNEVDLTIVFDNYPEETSWSILDENESVVASGGPYVNQPDGSILDLTFNLPDGQYQLVMKDAQGDGMCCDYGFGSYTLSSYGNLIASGGIFGFSDKIQFCVETPPPGGNELLTVVESGDFFPVGTHLVTCTVFDGSENSDVCTFVITVNDTEAPMIDTPCPENITLCGAQNVFWTPPTATDNCEVVSTVSNYDPGDYFGVGTYTVTYTFFDEAGLSVSCSFVITINPVPDVEISQEDVPLWCQGIQVLTANVLNPDDLTYPLTFEWSDGLPGDPVVIAPANGEYTVTVTDALNCSTVVSTVVDEDISLLFSAYTIISGEEFEMFASDVLGGGVGIEDADEGEIGLNSNIYTFFKANLANVMIDGSSYVNELIDADFDLPFPPFQGNSFNDLNNVVVPANTTMTLSGSNYGWVTVESGATLIIDNASMYFQNLTTKKDATIIFNQPSDLMIKRRMTIGETNTINPDEHTCVIYVQDKVSINQGSVVTANIYAPEGLDVNDSGATLTTYMTGIFISNDRIGSDHNVIWNWNLNCSYLPSADGGGIPLAQSEGKEAVDDIREVFVKDPDIGLNVYPNPASGIVNITVADLLGQEVELYLYDAFGKQVMRKPLGKLAVGTVSIDLSADRYTSGMYHVSLKAGEDWYNVRFILSK